MGWVIALPLFFVASFTKNYNLLMASAVFAIAGSISFVGYYLKKLLAAVAAIGRMNNSTR